MFKTVEVVESSMVGFPDAVKAAVNRMVLAGETVYFYEVVGQIIKGVRDNQSQEYQVTIKIGIKNK